VLCRAVLVIVVVAGRVAAAAPDDLIARPLVLDQGQARVDLTAEINFSSNLVGQPTSLAPDLWFGVLPELTVGLIHSDNSLDRIQPGASFCVRTDPIVCPDGYHGSGLDVLYSITAGSFAAAAHARVLLFEKPLPDDEPSRFVPAVTIGSALRWHRGRWSIDGDPYLQLGVANRPYGNRAQLWLPIVLAVQPIPRLAVEVHTGWNSALAIVGDGYNVPAGVGVRARALWNVDVGALFGFASSLGPQNDVKNRVLFFDLSWHSH
jgi:hypothetical protein